VGVEEVVAAVAVERAQAARGGEVRHIALDHTRARGGLGWEPRVTVREGLEQTLASLER
jgi:nucleoside-diphosphate-sugar epimerase